jgi:ribosome biogenesis protein ENP2
MYCRVIWQAIAEPFAYEEYRKERLEKLLEDGDAKRIKLRKAARALPKVNRRLAERIIEEGEVAPESRKRKKKKNKAVALAEGGPVDESNPLGDSRFSSMFTDAAFEVDEKSEQYKLLHPSESQAMASRPDLLVASDKFNAVEDSGESEAEGKGSDGSSSDSDDDAAFKARSSEKKAKLKAKKERQKEKKAATPKVSMLELNEGESYRPGMSRKDVQGEATPKGGKKTFGARLKTEVRPLAKVRDVGGGKEMSFSQSRSKPSDADSSASAARRKDQRGVTGLGLKKAPKQKYWRGKPV